MGMSYHNPKSNTDARSHDCQVSHCCIVPDWAFTKENGTSSWRTQRGKKGKRKKELGQNENPIVSPQEAGESTLLKQEERMDKMRKSIFFLHFFTLWSMNILRVEKLRRRRECRRSKHWETNFLSSLLKLTRLHPKHHVWMGENDRQ